MFKVLDAIADALMEVAVEMQVSVKALRETMLSLGHGSLDEEVVKALRSFGERGANSKEVRDKIEDSTGVSLHVREILEAQVRMYRSKRLTRVGRARYVAHGPTKPRTTKRST